MKDHRENEYVLYIPLTGHMHPLILKYADNCLYHSALLHYSFVSPLTTKAITKILDYNIIIF